MTQYSPDNPRIEATDDNCVLVTWRGSETLARIDGVKVLGTHNGFIEIGEKFIAFRPIPDTGNGDNHIKLHISLAGLKQLSQPAPERGEGFSPIR